MKYTMWQFIKIISFLVFFVLFGTIGCLTTVQKVPTQNQNNKNIIPNKDKTYVRLAETDFTKEFSNTFFNHPRNIRNDFLLNTLSAIYFKERGFGGRWKKERSVFLENELLDLLPHIINAFAKASPWQYVLVDSVCTKAKLGFNAERHTIFALFILNDKLNVAFSRIQYELLGKEDFFVDPLSIRKNPFWKLIPMEEQSLASGRQNIIVVNADKDSVVVARNDKTNNKVSEAYQDKQEGINNWDAAISIEDFYKTYLPINTDISRYIDSVQLTLMIKNNTDKIITAWRANLIVENPFGDILFRTQLTDGTANIRPEQIKEANFTWEDNQFIKDEVYDKLMSYDKGNLKLKITGIQVVHFTP